MYYNEPSTVILKVQKHLQRMLSPPTTFNVCCTFLVTLDWCNGGLSLAARGSTGDGEWGVTWEWRLGNRLNDRLHNEAWNNQSGCKRRKNSAWRWHDHLGVRRGNNRVLLGKSGGLSDNVGGQGCNRNLRRASDRDLLDRRLSLRGEGGHCLNRCRGKRND